MSDFVWLSLALGKGGASGGKGLYHQQSLEQKAARQPRKTAPMSPCFHWSVCSAALLHPSSTSLPPALTYLQTLGCQLLVPYAPSLQRGCPRIWHPCALALTLHNLSCCRTPWDVFYEGATLQVTPLKCKLLISKHTIQVLSLGADIQAPDKFSRAHTTSSSPLLLPFFFLFFFHLNARDLTHHIR